MFNGISIELIDDNYKIVTKTLLVKIDETFDREYFLDDYGYFFGFNIVRQILINRGVINDWRDYSLNELLSREYYDDLITEMLDWMLTSIVLDYDEIKLKYLMISRAIKTSGISYDWSKSLI